MRKPVVICVDDEPTVLESLKIELKQVLGNSCLIETAQGGDEALELFEELQSGEFEVAVVLADYIMPGLRGDEFVRQVHGLSPQTLNIMISGQADLEAVASSIRHARLYRYIPKPWEPDELKETVVEAIQSYLQDRKLEAQTTKLREVYEQVIALNSNLERQVQQRTQALQMAVANLERVGRLKDDFLNTVSHELRSPMSTIRMAIEMLELNLQHLNILQQHPDLIERYLRILKEECNREFGLINGLLDIAHVDASTEPLELTAVDLNIWIPHLVDAFSERAASQQQHLDCEISQPLPLILTDQLELERILIELLHNACKYTPTGEQILLTVELESEELGCSAIAGLNLPLPVEVTVIEPMPVFRLQVRNSGIAITPEQCDRLFEQFYRIPEVDQRQQGGTGLGLALVKRRVNRLEGRIEAHCEAGWMCFTLWLPQRQLEERNGESS